MKLQTNNIVTLCAYIQYVMFDFLKNNPDNEHIETVYAYALKEVMQATGGHMDPKFLSQIIHLETSVFMDSKIGYNGLIPC